MRATEVLGERICELAAHLNAANCRLLEMIAQFDREEGWGVDGCNSCAHWLNWKCGIGQNAGREKVRVAHALEKLPLIHASFSKGEISYSKVRAVSRVATPANEDYLLMIAEHGTAAHVETVVRGYRRAKADLELEDANARHQRRELSWYFDDDDMVVVKVRLTPEDGAHFIKAIEQATKDLRAQREDDAKEFEETSLCTDRADALIHVIAGPTDTEVQVHVSAETLVDFDSDGCCHLHNGPNLAPQTVRRLSCDAGIVRIVEDAKGQPLDVGRKTRTISPALKRALSARDQGCRFSGCGATRHLHGHHIEHWADGGPTSLDNLVQLCSHHHRLVHEGGFDVQALYEHAHGALAIHFFRPDGSRIDDAVPQHSIAACAEASIKQRNAQLGLAIDYDTAFPNWDGEPMDQAMAIDGMFIASGDFAMVGGGVSAETLVEEGF
ncbi:MAG: hypothetical protein ACI9DC_002789 [Gammaproteobacteria bacterium]|jgi:hypothetical protein